jgi:FKBP-type peptidyl-prolyl cis-trans isomerase SlyD
MSNAVFFKLYRTRNPRMSKNMRVTKNKVVYVTYVIINENGTVFEQSDIPIGYIQGSDKGLFLKVERRLEGCKVGDMVEVTLTPEEGFGDHDPGLTFTDIIDNVPPEYRHIGAQVQFQNEAGEVRDFFVTRIEGNQLTVDGNHPLAGHTVMFKVTVADIRDATPDELYNGEPFDAMPTLH